MFNKLLSFLLIVGLTMCFCDVILAQGKRKNSIGIAFGGSNFHILDKHATELIYSGTGIAPSIIFSHLGQKNNHIVEGKFYFNNLHTTSDNFKLLINTGHLRYTFLRILLTKNLFSNPFYLSAGASACSFYSKYDYRFYLQSIWANSIESWYGSQSADVVINISYFPCENHYLEISLFMPILSNVSRPAYSASGDYDYKKNDWEIKPFGNNQLISENFVFNTKIGYTYDLKNRLSFKAEHEFFYARNQYPDRLKLFMNNFRMVIIYNFKISKQEL